VLGPTFFGNAYQFTNSLPNLIYFGLLAGSLFSSLLVPALVEHVDAGNREASERVAGGFLGMTLVALLAGVPLAVVFGPVVLSLAATGAGTGAAAAAQEHVRPLAHPDVHPAALSVRRRRRGDRGDECAPALRARGGGTGRREPRHDRRPRRVRRHLRHRHARR